MTHIRRIHHLALFLATFVGALVALAVSAPAAFALRIPEAGETGAAPTLPSSTFTHTVVANGMPGWQITAIIAVVAVLAAAIAIAVDRARASHRTGMVPAT